MNKLTLRQAIILFCLVLATVLNLSLFTHRICRVCNPNFSLQQDQCKSTTNTSSKELSQRDQQKSKILVKSHDVLKNAGQKLIIGKQIQRSSRRLQSINFSSNKMKSTRPLKAGKQFIWKEAVLGLNSGNEVEEYLESAQEPKGLISISSVNQLLQMVNQYNAAYSDLPPIVLRAGKKFILTDIDTPINNISFSACTCNKPVSNAQLQTMREFATKINVKNIDLNIYPGTILQVSPEIQKKPFVFDPNLAVSITLVKVGPKFFTQIFRALNYFNSRRKVKDQALIIVNETGYQINQNNTANVKRFFFLTMQGHGNLSYASDNFTRFLINEQRLTFGHIFNSYFPDPQPTKNYYCLTQDPSRRFCATCFAGFTFKNGECLKQQSYCRKYNSYERVCINCNQGYYRHRLGMCLKPNLSESCLSFDLHTGKCNQCKYMYELVKSQCKYLQPSTAQINAQGMAQHSSLMQQNQLQMQSRNGSTGGIRLGQKAGARDYQVRSFKNFKNIIKKVAEIDDFLRGRFNNFPKNRNIRPNNYYNSGLNKKVIPKILKKPLSPPGIMNSNQNISKYTKKPRNSSSLTSTKIPHSSSIKSSETAKPKLFSPSAIGNVSNSNIIYKNNKNLNNSSLIQRKILYKSALMYYFGKIARSQSSIQHLLNSLPIKNSEITKRKPFPTSKPLSNSNLPNQNVSRIVSAKVQNPILPRI